MKKNCKCLSQGNRHSEAYPHQRKGKTEHADADREQVRRIFFDAAHPHLLQLFEVLDATGLRLSQMMFTEIALKW